MAHIESCPLCGTAVTAETAVCPHCQTNLQLASLIVSLNERVTRLEQNLNPEAAPDPVPAQSQGTKPLAPIAKPVETEETAALTVPQDSTAPPPPPPRPSRLPSDIWQSDFWLNKIGMGLLLLALAFLFSYAVDQGWLTPAVRVAIGLLAGTALLGIGYRIYGRRRHFGQVLLGGGIAAYYITGFAAFQLYELLSSPVAFGFMSLVTLLAFFLSLRQEEAMLSQIGIIGGLATPFLLYSGASNVPGLIAYTSLLIMVASAIYLFRGWQLLLWTAVIGGWLILLALLLDVPDLSDRWSVQIGIIITLIAAWIVPVGREVAAAASPAHWRPARFGFADSLIPASLQNLLRTDVYFSTILSPFIAIFMTWVLWELDGEEIGIFVLAGAFILAAMAWALKQTSARPQLWRMHGWVSLLFLLLASALFLEDDALFFAWLAGAAALQLTAARYAFPLPEKVGTHSFGVLVGMGLAGRLVSGQSGTAVFNIPALVDLLAIGTAVAIPFLWRAKDSRLIVWLAAHIALLIWLARELGSMRNGTGLVSVAWGIYALLLLAIGLIFHFSRLRTVAVATLFILAGKLILVDLVTLQAIWRILLFAGVGGLFLVVSYFYRSFLTADEGSE